MINWSDLLFPRFKIWCSVMNNMRQSELKIEQVKILNQNIIWA